MYPRLFVDDNALPLCADCAQLGYRECTTVKIRAMTDVELMAIWEQQRDRR